MDIKTVPDAYSMPLKDFLPIRHWGQKCRDNEKFIWFIPGEKERKLCEMLIWRYVVPTIDVSNLGFQKLDFEKKVFLLFFRTLIFT